MISRTEAAHLSQPRDICRPNFYPYFKIIKCFTRGRADFIHTNPQVGPWLFLVPFPSHCPSSGRDEQQQIRVDDATPTPHANDALAFDFFDLEFLFLFAPAGPRFISRVGITFFGG